MEELLIGIARGLVDDKDAVTVTVDEPNEEGVVVYHLHVGADDVGRVIGRNGKVANSLRTIVKSASIKSGKRFIVKIGERD